MANYGDQLSSVLFQTAGSAIDPGSNSVYITAIINGTDTAVVGAVDIESKTDVSMGAGAAINLDPPFKCPADETVTPALGLQSGIS